LTGFAAEAGKIKIGRQKHWQINIGESLPCVKFGFKVPYSGGKHLYVIKDNLRLTLPNPHRKSISVDLLAKILNHAGITREEWLQN